MDVYPRRPRGIPEQAALGRALIHGRAVGVHRHAAGCQQEAHLVVVRAAGADYTELPGHHVIVHWMPGKDAPGRLEHAVADAEYLFRRQIGRDAETNGTASRKHARRDGCAYRHARVKLQGAIKDRRAAALKGDRYHVRIWAQPAGGQCERLRLARLQACRVEIRDLVPFERIPRSVVQRGPPLQRRRGIVEHQQLPLRGV